MTSLRVLHVVPHLDRVGGYERQARALARAQNRHAAVEPILLTHAAPGRPAFERVPEGEIHRLSKGLRRHDPSAWWHRHGARVDVVHAHALHKLSGQVLALAHARGTPSFVKVATADDLRMFSDPGAWTGLLDGDESVPAGVRWRLMVTIAWRRLRTATAFVALDEALERELADLELPRVRLPNGVDTEHFRPPTPDEREAARAQLGLAPESPCIGSVGRLATRKDPAGLVETFARVRTGHPGLGLVVAGDGPARAALQRALADTGCRERALLTGEIADVRTVLWALDVFVHASRREGQPNAVLEALACGLPVVASDIPAHRGLLGSHGRLAPVGAVDALAAHVSALLADPGLGARLGRTGRRHVEDHHAMAAVAARSLALYRDVMPGRPATRSEREEAPGPTT